MDIKLEKTILGKNWNRAHGGYFSDKTVSCDYLTEIFKIIEKIKPDTFYLHLFKKGFPKISGI